MGKTSIDRQRRPLDTTGGEAAMRPGLVVHLELESERVRQRVSVRTDGRTEADDQPIQIVSAQTGIVQSITNSLAGEINGTAIEPSAVGRVADATDRGFVFQIPCSHGLSSPGDTVGQKGDACQLEVMRIRFDSTCSGISGNGLSQRRTRSWIFSSSRNSDVILHCIVLFSGSFTGRHPSSLPSKTNSFSVRPSRMTSK